jgi:hypothetical protein
MWRLIHAKVVASDATSDEKRGYEQTQCNQWADANPYPQDCEEGAEYCESVIKTLHAD